MPPRKRSRDIFGGFKDAVRTRFALAVIILNQFACKALYFCNPGATPSQAMEHLKVSFQFFNAHQVPGFEDWWANHGDEIREKFRTSFK
jgi:hypothetical protein